MQKDLRTSRYQKEVIPILFPKNINEFLFIAKECIVINDFILIEQILCTQPDDIFLECSIQVFWFRVHSAAITYLTL